MASNESYDLLILIDSTASMGSYLRSLHKSLQSITRISSLTGRFSRIGVMTYGDYCGGPLSMWSGWHSDDQTSEVSQQRLLDFVTNLRARGGGDWPEATKTGLAHAHSVMRSDATTIILLYTDAPPHMSTTKGYNYTPEQRNLKASAYGDSSPLFADWASAALTLRHGEKRAKVFGMVEPGNYSALQTLSPYVFLSEVTEGYCLQLNINPSSDDISGLTIGLLLSWMGVEKEGAKLSSRQLAKLVNYKDRSAMGQVVTESSEQAAAFIAQLSVRQTETAAVLENMQYTDLTLENMAHMINDPDAKAVDFSTRYNSDPAHRERVTKHMESLIESDVVAIGLNPVFGSLWRAVCNDRANPMRDALITKFGLQVSKLEGSSKERMRTWLEESYDRVGEILDIIRTVPDEALYPCVLLDPTVGLGEGKSDEEREKLTRDELLEIGRSCDVRILRRLGRILTRLTYVEKKSDLPAYLENMAVDEVPRIPMALAEATHGRNFWKVLLHCVLPGTMLAARPAALLAALSLQMGIKPLEDGAYAELVAWRDKWNTLDIPETWNTGCLTLLLRADEKARVARMVDGWGEPILLDADRRLFKTLVHYKLLEFNLKTTLTARIGWRPERVKMPIGPLFACKACHYPRSVTIMGREGICGMCDPAGYDESEDEAYRQRLVEGHVSKGDSKDTLATWVECSVASCRAQYVVYFVENLNVRPKCYYCRQIAVVSKNHPDRERLTVAPCVECTNCLSRIIWPAEYRPQGFDETTYRCVGCENGQRTVVDEETSAEKLLAENPDSGWLLRNSDNKIAQPFSGRSLFHVISTAGIDGFADKVAVLPGFTHLEPMVSWLVKPPELRIRGKLIRNPLEIIESLREWIVSGKVEQGTCSLCFNQAKKQDLRSPCLRTGCREVVCDGCVSSWYGLNSRGRIINIAALCCPFCRRQPSARAPIPGGLNCLVDLKEAVQESNQWIFAWCNRCGFARRFLERACATGAPAEVESWVCRECEERSVQDKGKVSIKDVRECPGCGVKTEKEYGCDHIACPVEGCGTHWCYQCGEASSEEDIYDHMAWNHGGYYGGMESDSDDDAEVRDCRG